MPEGDVLDYAGSISSPSYRKWIVIGGALFVVAAILLPLWEVWKIGDDFAHVRLGMIWTSIQVFPRADPDAARGTLLEYLLVFAGAATCGAGIGALGVAICRRLQRETMRRRSGN